MGTVRERQRCKVQGNSNLLHNCAIYLFPGHSITFISLLLVQCMLVHTEKQFLFCAFGAVELFC